MAGGANDSETMNGFHCRKTKQAFSVIELAVVLAVLSVLALSLAPGLARTKPGAFTAQCVNNLRQLGAGWRMYSEDNNGRLVYNRSGGTVPGSESWAGGFLDYTSSPDNTNTALLVDHERYPYSAYLGPYVKTPRLFKCPADPAMVNMAGQRVPRVRSISMNSRVGEGARPWLSYTTFLMYSNMRDISSPPPAQLFVFLDEHEASINDAVFVTDPDTRWVMIDYPASYHDGGAGFTFADGHSQIHRWQDRRTMPVIPPGQYLPLNVLLPGSVDVLWLQQHAAARK